MHGKPKYLTIAAAVMLGQGVLIAPGFVNGQTAYSAPCPAVSPDQLYRNVGGIDSCPVPLGEAELAALTDPFATALLQQGEIPGSLPHLDVLINSALGWRATVYVAGDGAHIPLDVASRTDPRYMRYIMTWGENEFDIQIAAVKFGAAEEIATLEIMALDESTGGFNYYVLGHQEGVDNPEQFLSWAGHTNQAFEPETQNEGCFACHHNGQLLMKEIETPWANWNSQRFWMSASMVSPEMASEPYFVTRRGAEVLDAAIRGHTQNYYDNWFAERIEYDGDDAYVSDVSSMLRYLFTDTTVNFKTSDVASAYDLAGPPGADIRALPPRDTFLADSILRDTLRINYTGLSLTLDREAYDAFLRDHNYRLRGTPGFDVTAEPVYEFPGTSYFAYMIPQISHEDIYVIQQLLRHRIVPEQFVASALMVDFPNPLFSEARGSLMEYANLIGDGLIINGESTVFEDFLAELEMGGAETCRGEILECSPEDQFMYYMWLDEDEWRTVMGMHLQSYVTDIASLPADQQVDYLMSYAAIQRDRLAATAPLCNLIEHGLLFPTHTISEMPRCPGSGD